MLDRVHLRALFGCLIALLACVLLPLPSDLCSWVSASYLQATTGKVL